VKNHTISIKSPSARRFAATTDDGQKAPCLGIFNDYLCGSAAWRISVKVSTGPAQIKKGAAKLPCKTHFFRKADIWDTA